MDARQLVGGAPPCHINIGRHGAKATVGLPGTGLSYSSKVPEVVGGSSAPSGIGTLTKVLVGVAIAAAAIPLLIMAG